MKYVLDELFEDAGRQTSDYLDCRLLDPMYRLYFADKTMLARSRPSDMREEIERVFPGEGKGLDRFLSAESIRFKKLYPCLQKDYGSVGSLLCKTLMSALPHIAPGRSLYDVLSTYFRSEQLRLALPFNRSIWGCLHGTVRVFLR